MSPTESTKPSSMDRPRVVLRRVENRAQSYAAHSVDDNTLLGYCGRDGRIVVSAGKVPPGTKTTVMSFDDPRIPKLGLKKSIQRIEGLVAPDLSSGRKIKQIRTVDTKPRWEIVERKQVGLYASGPITGPDWGNPGYFQLVYEITERKTIDGDRVRMRTRVEYGEPCRLYGEAYAVFAGLYATYENHAKAHEAGQHAKNERGECVAIAKASPPPVPVAPKPKAPPVAAAPTAKKGKKTKRPRRVAQ